MSNKDRRAMEEERDNLSTCLMVALPDVMSKVCAYGWVFYRAKRWLSPSAGPLAQSVERRADNAKVVSSRLTWTTFSQPFFFPWLFFFYFFLPSPCSLEQWLSRLLILLIFLRLLTWNCMQRIVCRRLDQYLLWL